MNKYNKWQGDLFADFETLSTDKPEVYSWAIGGKTHGKRVQNGFTAKYGIDIKSFIEEITSYGQKKKIYFNNSRSFDGHFILAALINEGYRVKDIYNEDSIDRIQEWYDIKLKWEGKYPKAARTSRLLEFHETYILYTETTDPTLKSSLFSILNREHQTRMKYITKHGVEEFKRWEMRRISGKLLPKEFTVISDNNKRIFEISIENNQVPYEDLMSISVFPDGGHSVRCASTATKIWDNLYIFPASVKQMGEMVGMPKLDLDNGYDKQEKYASIEELQNDGNELEYLIRDVQILYEYHLLMNNKFKDYGMQKPKMTIGATAYAEWQRLFGDKLLKKALEDKRIEKIDNTYYVGGTLNGDLSNSPKKIGKINQARNMLIEEILPTKWMDVDIHTNISKWYTGGITMVNEDHRGDYIENVTVLDINSAYPSVMYSDNLIPVGKPLTEKELKELDPEYDTFNFYVLKVYEKGNINRYGLPFMYNKLSEHREYLKNLTPGVYYITDSSIEQFAKYYDIDWNKCDLEVKYTFKARKSSFIYEDFINTWYNLKAQASAEGDVALKQIAKLLLNSLYGKSGTKIIRKSKIFTQEGWVQGEGEELESLYYLPIACAITEMGRMKLVDAVDTQMDKFIYGDTDSIFMKDFTAEGFPHIDLHPTRLGAWDIEYEGVNGIARRPKQYYYTKGDTLKAAYAGINGNAIMFNGEDREGNKITAKDMWSMEDFIYGTRVPQQLQGVKINGYGIKLENRVKSINPIWEYPKLTEQTKYNKEHFMDWDKNMKKD